MFMKCLHCATELTGKYAKKFCSLSCSASFNNSATPKRIKKHRICPVCDSTHSKKQYCSKKCSGIAHRNYATEEERIKILRANRRAAYKLYIARRRYNTPIGADLIAIKKFYYNCPVGYEVDHVVPISKGGAHDIANLQYLTATENRKKSNKIIAG